MSKNLPVSERILIPPLLAVVLFASLLSNRAAFAAEAFVLPREQSVNGTLIKAGDDINIEGVVNGDLLVAAGAVNIEGIVHGDVLAIGGIITVNGEVQGDVRLLGGVVVINGKVNGNATVVAASLNTSKDSEIGGDLVGGVDKASLGGQIGKNANLIGSRLALTGRVDGHLTYASSQKPQISQGAQIGGRIVSREAAFRLPRHSLTIRLINFLGLWLLGGVVLLVAPRQTLAISNLVLEQPGKSFGLGLLALILAPAAVVLLAVSLVGIPLGAVLLGVYVLLAYTAPVFVGLLIGRRLLGREGLMPLALGLLLLEIAGVLPFVGFFTHFAAAAVGVGAALILKSHAIRRLQIRS